MKKKEQWSYYWRKVEKVLTVRVTPSYRKLLMETYSEEQFEAALADLPAYIGSLEFGMIPKASMFEQVLKGARAPEPEPPSPPKPEPEPEKAEGGEPQVWWLEEYPELPNLIRVLMENNLSGKDWCLDFALAGALATVAGAIGNKLRFYSWGVYGYSNEFVMLIGETGSTFKTYQVSSVYQLMSEVNPALLAPDAGSWQGLMRHLCDTPSALWCLDEWSGLLGEIKTADYQKRLREILQTLFHHGGTFKRRLSRDSYESDNPALTILTGIQPGVFGEEMLGRREVEGGLVNRFLLVLADMPEERWPSQEWDVRETQKNRCIRKLRELGQASATVYADPVQDLASIWRGRAKEFFGDEGEVVGQRGGIHALKLACLLWAADVGMPPNRTAIPEQYVKMALDILERWFYRAAGFVADVRIKTPGEAVRREILEFIRGRDGQEATVKDIGHFAQLSKRQLADHLETLVEREAIACRQLEDGRESYFIA